MIWLWSILPIIYIIGFAAITRIETERIGESPWDYKSPGPFMKAMFWPLVAIFYLPFLLGWSIPSTIKKFKQRKISALPEAKIVKRIED